MYKSSAVSALTRKSIWDSWEKRKWDSQRSQRTESKKGGGEEWVRGKKKPLGTSKLVNVGLFTHMQVEHSMWRYVLAQATFDKTLIGARERMVSTPPWVIPRSYSSSSWYRLEHVDFGKIHFITKWGFCFYKCMCFGTWLRANACICVSDW